MITIRADELRVRDVISYNGQLHVVTRVERRAEWAWPIAADATGWAIALGPYLVKVLRPAA